MTFRLLTTLLFFVIATGSLLDGIIPALIGKILLLKGTLLLSPPIALGAFVVGQGTGLLIGKLLGISLVVSKWLAPIKYNAFKEAKYFQNHYGPQAYKAFDYYHQHYPDEHHHHQFPYTSGWENYNDHSQYQSNPYVQTSLTDYYNHLYGYPYSYDYYKYQHYTPSQQDTPVNELYESNDHHDEIPHYTNDNFYEPPSSTYHDYSSNSPGTNSYEYETVSTEIPDNPKYYETSDGPEYEYETDNRYKKSPVVKVKPKGAVYEPEASASAAEDYIIKNFLKVTNDNEKTEEEKLDELASLLQQQFHDEFLKAVSKEDAVTPFVPFPSKSPPLAELKTDLSDERLNPTAPNEITVEKTSKPKKLSAIMSKVIEAMSISKQNPIDLVADSLVSWMFEGKPKSEPEEALHLAQRRRTRRSASTEAIDSSSTPLQELDIDMEKVTVSFVRDVQNLFSIVSFLDINQCLEKMICEIHTRKNYEDMSEYEKNIVTAFRIMDKMMPLETSPVDSTTRYRQAAKLGRRATELIGKNDACLRLYRRCGFSTQQIVDLGSISIPVPQSSQSVTESSPLSLSRMNPEEMDANSGV